MTRILILDINCPFIHGGAEMLRGNLVAALRDAGHVVDTLILPFRYAPFEAVADGMVPWLEGDFTEFNGIKPDVVLSLRFPAYLVSHPRHRLWLLHQHRHVTDQWPGDDDAPEKLVLLREKIRAAEAERLSAIKDIRSLSATVSRRLLEFNGLVSTPLYHPPPDAELLHCHRAEPFLLAVSRLEHLKRLDLFVGAIARCHEPVEGVIIGDGGQRPILERLAEDLGVADRVRFLGQVDRKALIRLYACCRGVFFGPVQEDYGYVTLEAMLSAKPVVTCTDSGGPCEFIVHGQSGWVVPPEAPAVAAAFDELWADPGKAADHGRAGRITARTCVPDWPEVVATILGETS